MPCPTRGNLTKMASAAQRGQLQAASDDDSPWHRGEGWGREKAYDLTFGSDGTGKMNNYDLHLALLELKLDCKPSIWKFMVKQQLYDGATPWVKQSQTVPINIACFATFRGALLQWWEVTGGNFKSFYPSNFL